MHIDKKKYQRCISSFGRSWFLKICNSRIKTHESTSRLEQLCVRTLCTPLWWWIGDGDYIYSCSLLTLEIVLWWLLYFYMGKVKSCIKRPILCVCQSLNKYSAVVVSLIFEWNFVEQLKQFQLSWAVFLYILLDDLSHFKTWAVDPRHDGKCKNKKTMQALGYKGIT